MINTLFDVQKKKKIIEFDESWQKKCLFEMDNISTSD